MAGRKYDLKPTNEKLALDIEQEEGISAEEAKKKLRGTAWKEEADALPLRVLHKRLDYNQKPLRYMLDPNEDPHRDAKSYGYKQWKENFFGTDYSFELPEDAEYEAIKEKALSQFTVEEQLKSYVLDITLAHDPQMSSISQQEPASQPNNGQSIFSKISPPSKCRNELL